MWRWERCHGDVQGHKEIKDSRDCCERMEGIERSGWKRSVYVFDPDASASECNLVIPVSSLRVSRRLELYLMRLSREEEKV